MLDFRLRAQRNLFRRVSFAGFGMAVSAVALTLSLPAAGQGTPQPAPGTPSPAAPGPAPTSPPEGLPGPDNAARARAAALAAKANIDVTDAWTRATTGNATTAAIYLHLVSAKDPDRLVGVEVSNAAKIEVREDTPQGAGAAKSAAVPAVDIPAGGSVNFAPGGRYLLLTGLKAPLKEGESFLITLSFDKAGTQSTVVKILGAAANGPPQTNAARRGDTTAGVTER